jgi:hypothetical protein
MNDALSLTCGAVVMLIGAAGLIAVIDSLTNRSANYMYTLPKPPDIKEEKRLVAMLLEDEPVKHSTEVIIPATPVENDTINEE